MRTKHIDCVRLRPLNNNTHNEDIAQGITLTHIFSNCSYFHIHSPNNPQINPQSRFPKSLFRRCDLITALISGLHLRAPCAHSRVLPLVQSKQKRISKRNPRCLRTKLRKQLSLTSGEKIGNPGKRQAKKNKMTQVVTKTSSKKSLLPTYPKSRQELSTLSQWFLKLFHY